MTTLLDIETVNAPVVVLIDGSAEGLDEATLKRRARAHGAAMGPGKVSRSYCHPYALVGWHTGPVGVDIERVVACDEQFARSIGTPAEQANAPLGTDREIVSRWSSKEALAKALGDAVQYDPRRLESPAGWVDGASGPWRASMLSAPTGYCAWVCWRDRDCSDKGSPVQPWDREPTTHTDRGTN